MIDDSVTFAAVAVVVASCVEGYPIVADKKSPIKWGPKPALIFQNLSAGFGTLVR